MAASSCAQRAASVGGAILVSWLARNAFKLSSLVAKLKSTKNVNRLTRTILPIRPETVLTQSPTWSSVVITECGLVSLRFKRGGHQDLSHQPASGIVQADQRLTSPRHFSFNDKLTEFHAAKRQNEGPVCEWSIMGETNSGARKILSVHDERFIRQRRSVRG